MSLSKSVLLLFFLYLNKYSHGDENCTISDFLLQQFKEGEYKFDLGQRLEVTNSSISPVNYYEVTRLVNYENCLGFTTETLDTIVLDCPEKSMERIGCFQVFTPQYNTTLSIENERKICASKLNESCIGLLIKDKITIILKCSTSNCFQIEGRLYGLTKKRIVRIRTNKIPPRE
ncbi:uncharacterized protein LOC108905675 [Anoplophora glabripennis]|uniref:uncharacterized protein LOC108905675 n=1 Tax=Anoplophora glabripennis TaxID=217634 RepID=UPI0008737FA4|nr:uncharacterized protein LOC108905675 [Anoplophora glabripennis]